MQWYHLIWIPIVAGVGLVAYMVGIRKGRPSVDEEVAAVDIKARVRELEAEQGAQHAREWVEAEYAETIAELTEAQRDEARVLRNDPPGLAEFLLRAGFRG